MTMVALRQVVSVRGVKATLSNNSRPVRLPQGTAILVLKEMGQMVRIAVRVNGKPMEMLIRYHVVFNFTSELRAAA